METAQFSNDRLKYFLFFLAVLLSRLPFISDGYGLDGDSWAVALTARNIHDTGSYEASRLPGYPVQELLRGDLEFIGAHPMAGSEKCGHEAGCAELFQGRACFVTPLDNTPAAAVEGLVRFWHALGCEVVTMHPDRHDEIVAHVSHLPHLLAASLCALLAGKHADWRNLAGPGLRDTTRVASGDPKLWRGILDANRDEVLRALRSYQDELQALHAALANRNDLELLAILERGKAWRDKLRVNP